MSNDGELSVTDEIGILYHFKHFEQILEVLEGTTGGLSRLSPADFATDPTLIELLYYKIKTSRIKKIDDVDILISLFRDIEDELETFSRFDYYYYATDLFRRGDKEVAFQYFKKLEDLYENEMSGMDQAEVDGRYNLLVGTVYDPLELNHLINVDEKRYSEERILGFLTRAEEKARADTLFSVQVLEQLASYYHYRMLVEKELQVRLKAIGLEKNLASLIDTPVFDYLGRQYSHVASLAKQLGNGDDFRHYSQVAIDLYNKSMNDDRTNRGKKATIAAAIGKIYYRIGDIRQAIEFASSAADLAKFQDNINYQVTYIEHLAKYHIHLGEYETSIDLYHQIMDLNKKMQSTMLDWRSRMMLGSIYQRLGQLDKALGYLEEANTISSHSHSVMRKIVEVATILGKKKIAKNYLSILKEKKKKSANPFLLRSYQLAKAFVLKESGHMRDKVEAEDILREVLGSPKKSFHYTVLATKYLCEIFLFEIQMTRDESLFSEIKGYVKNLHDSVDLDHSGMLIYDILLLKSRLAFVEGDLDCTVRYLDEAIETARERNLWHVVTTLQQEKKQVEEELQRWDAIIQENPDLMDRIAKSDLKEYLDFAMSQIEIEK